MTASWPMSSAVASAPTVVRSTRRLATAAWCFHSSSYTRPRRERGSSTESGFGALSLAAIADGTIDTAHAPAGVVGGVGVGVGVPPLHAARKSARERAPIQRIIARIIRVRLYNLVPNHGT